jgi:hypothetical protein
MAESVKALALEKIVNWQGKKENFPISSELDDLNRYSVISVKMQNSFCERCAMITRVAVKTSWMFGKRLCRHQYRNLAMKVCFETILNFHFPITNKKP